MKDGETCYDRQMTLTQALVKITWPLKATAGCGGFPYWFRYVWGCREYILFNWFIQMKYSIAQIKIIKNYYFLQLNEVKHVVFILFLVIFVTYQIMCELFFAERYYWIFGSELFCLPIENRYLYIFCAFLSSDGSYDKQNLTFVAIW